MTFYKSYKNKSLLLPAANALALICSVGASTAWGNNLPVNSPADTITPGDTQCTLREAIANANSDSDTTGGDCLAGSGADTISFTIDGNIVLGSTLTINDSAGITIDGTGHSIILNGNKAVRVLMVNQGITLTVKNLTVANGYTANDAFGGGSGGGIINNKGFLNVVGCTFSGNSAMSHGGAIANLSNFDIPTVNGVLSVTNSTFNGNTAFWGGAIHNSVGGTFSLVNSTVVGNSTIRPLCTGICAQVMPGVGGIDNSSAMTLHNNIVAGNTVIYMGATTNTVGPSDIGGGINSSSNSNLIGSPNTYFYGIQNGVNGNVIGIDVNTVINTTLANNGGPTQTFALLANSIALNTATAANCPATDQRGVSRPQGAGCDTGAFETEVSADLAVTQTATPNPVVVRDALTWTITVTNNGAANATGVSVVDTLPASSLSSISASASQGSCGALTGGKITCNLGDLANTGTATVTVRGIPTATGTLTNQATVSSSQPDNQLANNTSTQAATVQALLCKGVKPTIVGTPGPNTLKGTRGRDVIHGLGGNDVITGGNDNDIICGGEGNDSIYGEGGNDSLDGGAGTDSCIGGSGTDTGTNCEVRNSIP